MHTEGLNFSGAPLYSLPWYFLIPLLAAGALLGLARAGAGRVGGGWVLRRLAVAAFFCAGVGAAALLMFLGDDPSTATMFAIALLFYGLLFFNPVVELTSLVRGRDRPATRTGQALWGAANILLLAVAAYSWLIEPYRIQVSRHRLMIPGAPSLRLVQLSDIQAEYPSRRERDAARIVNRLEPDLVVVTGDNYTGTRRHQAAGAEAALKLLRGLRTRRGIYGISGSSSPAGEDAAFFAEAGAAYLNNDSVLIEDGDKSLVLAGLDYLRPDPGRALAGYEGRPSIVLYHSPSLAFDAGGGPHRWSEALPTHFSRTPRPNSELAELGVKLLLTGHTHGGQVRFPGFGALLTGTTLGNDYVAGLHEVGGFTLYINRGLGMDGRFAPKIRFLCPPEITLFEINPRGTDREDSG